ncbi:MAG TPA: response regulator transcription factor [Opitutaceae bacterium]|nr:response regulator transcription factor [Lacunisphaera sp.]HWA09086.1 response regulator transcription factor [Opitutaceae bacterium]
MRILVVEDERKIATFIRKALVESGFNPLVCGNGDDALALTSSERFDAIVLDVMLPGRDGLSVLRQLRAQHNTVPVILLTARGGLTERIEGLNLGADDYLSKPFSMEELIARLRAVRRRLTGDGLSVQQYEDLMLNLITHEVSRAGRKLELTAREYALLEYLLRSPGRVFTRTQLCEQVWDYHFDPGTNVVDVCVQRLRRKIDDGQAVKLIHTVRGVGYTLKASA